MAGGHQASVAEPTPHLTAQPARLELGGAGPVVGEDVDHRVLGREGQELVEVVGAEQAYAVPLGEHGGSLDRRVGDDAYSTT